MPSRKKDRGFLILTLIALLALSSVFFISYQMHRIAREQMLNDFKAQMERTVEIVKERIETSLQKDQVLSQNEYTIIKHELKQLRRVSKLETLMVYDTELRSIVDARNNIHAGHKYSYWHLNPEVIDQVAQGIPKHHEHFATHSPITRSYGTPLIINGIYSGGVFAHADPMFEQELQALKNRWIISMIIFTLGFLALSIVFLWLYRTNRRMLKHIEKQSRMEMIHNLSGGIAHEIKTPVAAIAQGVSLLEKSNEGLIDQKEIQKIISDSCQNIQETLQDLLQTNQDNHDEIISIPQFMNKIKKRFDPLFIRKKCRLTMFSNPIIIKTDPQALRLILHNLIYNAFEAIPEEIGKVTITTKVKGNNLLFYCEDNGPGLTPKQQKKVFEPGHTTKEKGSGLGLSVSKEIVELLGGTLNVTAKESSGSVFTFSIPCDITKIP